MGKQRLCFVIHRLQGIESWITTLVLFLFFFLQTQFYVKLTMYTPQNKAWSGWSLRLAMETEYGRYGGRSSSYYR